MTEDYGLSFAPVLVVDARPIFGSYRGHGYILSLRLTPTWLTESPRMNAVLPLHYQFTPLRSLPTKPRRPLGRSGKRIRPSISASLIDSNRLSTSVAPVYRRLLM